MPAQIVRDDRVRYAVRAELESCQRGTLVAWAGFIDPDVQRHSRIVRHVDRRERRAPINTGEPTSVTVREDVQPATARFGKSADDFQPVHTDRAALLDVGIADCGGLPK